MTDVAAAPRSLPMTYTKAPWQGCLSWDGSILLVARRVAVPFEPIMDGRCLGTHGLLAARGLFEMIEGSR